MFGLGSRNNRVRDVSGGVRQPCSCEGVDVGVDALSPLTYFGLLVCVPGEGNGVI